MKKILFCLLIINLMFTGLILRNGMALASQPLDVTLLVDKNAYVVNSEPIEIAIVIENLDSKDIITASRFSETEFHLLLTFTRQDGFVITAEELGTGILKSDTPPVLRVGNELVQVDPVEILPGTDNPVGAFILSVTLPNAIAYYSKLNKAGRYCVKTAIPMRTYAEIFQTMDGVDYAKLEPALFEGVIESNTVCFFLVADEDRDGYSYPIAMSPPAADKNSLPDCEDRPNGEDEVKGTLDDGANINPGMIETPGNGIDDDCNPATLDKGADCCKEGKPRILTMKYRALDCSFTDHRDNTTKVKCEDFDKLLKTVFIVANDRPAHDQKETKIWFRGYVNLDETFDIDAANAGETVLKTNTFVHIFGNDPAIGGKKLQVVQFFITCSEPLLTGDQFGSLLLLDCKGEKR